MKIGTPRSNAALDFCEPLRPICDRLVLNLVLKRPFRRGELWDLRDGRCRLDQEFAGHFCGRWVPTLRREAAPIVEWVASRLRRARIEPEGPAYKVERAESIGACPECGSPVRPGRRFCSAACYEVWWRGNVQRRISTEGNETPARLRANGQDPAYGGDVGKRRAAAVSRANRLEWATLTHEERQRRTAQASASRWRARGRYLPGTESRKW